MFFAIAAVAPLVACETAKETRQSRKVQVPADEDANWYVAMQPDSPHDIPLIDWSLVPEEYHRQTVTYTGSERSGTIIVNVAERHLYLVQDGGRAVRYGVGVGRDGYSLNGTVRVGRKAVWPGWSPTPTMVSALPSLPRHLEGGLGNPLGARALYLYRGNQDTLFRIHGTNEPWSIGQAVSSGCIRMMNEDVLDLYNRVDVGTTVVVRQGGNRQA